MLQTELDEELSDEEEKARALDRQQTYNIQKTVQGLKRTTSLLEKPQKEEEELEMMIETDMPKTQGEPDTNKLQRSQTNGSKKLGVSKSVSVNTFLQAMIDKKKVGLEGFVSNATVQLKAGILKNEPS